MKLKLHICACLWALLFLPLCGWSSTTRQVRDTLIIGNVKYAINTAPLGQLDSLHYCLLRDQVCFNEFFSWNFRGYVATWRVNGNQLYLDKLETGSDKADFRDVLTDFKDGVLTYAGLLMFGDNDVVRKYVNNFWVDYIEIPGISYSDAAVRFSYRLPELDNIWECYEAIIQRLRLHVDAAPFSPQPDGFAPDDESQLYALREGLVNMCSHADYFSPMHPTIRVFDNRIIFQNPGKIAVDMKHLRDRYQSAPRNPSILKLFRYTKISDNAGYGMDKIYSWERLTGEKVEIETNTMCTDVTFWRPKIGTSIKRRDEKNPGSFLTETTQKTAQNSTQKTTQRTTLKMRDKILRIVKSSPILTIKEVADLCGLTYDGAKYHFTALRKAGKLERSGGDNGGVWVVKE